MDDLTLPDILEMIEAYEYLLGHPSQMTYNDLAFMFDTSLNVVKAVMSGTHPLQVQGFSPALGEPARIKRVSKPRTDIKPRKIKTHCKQGHELFGDNLRIYDYDGKIVRQCKQCQMKWRRLKKDTTKVHDD